MPQAPDELRAKFPGWDQEAHAVLAEHFDDDNGMIRPKVAGYQWTPREAEAIDYLILEWDYEYSSDPVSTSDRSEK